MLTFFNPSFSYGLQTVLHVIFGRQSYQINSHEIF